MYENQTRSSGHRGHQKENCTEMQAGDDDLRSRDVQQCEGTGDRESALQRQDPQSGALM